MGRASTRQNKTPYQLAREELGLSRERAAELLEQDGEEDLYVVTCFSDRDKLLDLPCVKKEV